MTSDDVLFGALNPEELEEFKRRHPEFGGALARLQTALGAAFLREMRPRPGKPAALQEALFFLGHQATADFYDIVQLAVHAYGVGALKLLRPLYERVVSALYLIEHPDEVRDFNDYADVDAWRLISHAKRAGVDAAAFMSAHELAEIKSAYERARQRFTAPGKKRERGSWARQDLAVRAKEVGLGPLYGACAFWPTMLLHTTRVSLEARLATTSTGRRAFTHEPQREHADWATWHAHDLIVVLLHKCNEFFAWGLDVRSLAQDVVACWGGGGATPLPHPP